MGEEPTVADLLDRTWEPAPWPEGHACIYKATLIGTTRAYVGKAVDLLTRFRNHMCADEYIARALNAHGPENFSIEVLRVFETEAEAYDQEGSFMEAHRTRPGHGGFNIAEGGKGFTSEEGRRAGALGSATRSVAASIACARTDTTSRTEAGAAQLPAPST